MSACKRQAVIEAPVDAVWELVGNPSRHPEWYPKVIEVKGERFEEGDQYAQVTKDPVGSSKTDFVIERMDDMREIRLVCQTTGMYAHWVLTDAQGATFVDVEMGMQPRTASTRFFDTVIGRMYFRRWLEQSIEALERVAERPASAPPAA